MNSKVFTFIAILLVVSAIGLTITFSSNRPEPTAHVNEAGKAHELTVYQSPTCGCCPNWVSYMRVKDYKVDVIKTDEIDAIKEEYGVPEGVLSCHTTIVNGGQYFIEGHIPEEAVAKLLEEEPAIKGIGLAGMPSASPGMPGEKLGPFEIMQTDLDGRTTNYMSL